MKFFSPFFEALGFITNFPIPKTGHSQPDSFGRAMIWHPVAGMLVGLLTAFLFWLAAALFPSPIPAVLTVIAWILLTGALHWDGFSDTCDGFFYAGDPEKRLRIMKDIQHGTFSQLGVLCLILLKVAAIGNLGPKQVFYLFPLIAALARLGTVFLLQLPVVNPNGLAAGMKASLPKYALLLSSIAPFFLALFGLATGMVLMATAALCWFLIGRLALYKIGGITGDVLGFSIEVTETILLIACTLIKTLQPTI